MNLTPVILCGGSGTRLWPLSRAAMPKQLLPLTGPRSLLQQTWMRVRDLGQPSRQPVVICNDAHRYLVDTQLREVGSEPLLVLEPAGRNTAPAVALAALLLAETQGEDTLLLVLPSDHVVADEDTFRRAVTESRSGALERALVTFGIVPDRAETGYGYIRAAPGSGLRRVEQFVEKPDLPTAQSYVASGQYLWNGGMFLFTAGAYLAELGMHAPDVLESCRAAVAGGRRAAHGFAPGRDEFLACRSVSIDYAVMERTDKARVIALEAGWSDVGSWAALHDVSERDAAGNAVTGDVVATDCRHSYLRAESRLVGVVGLEGCVVVETKDAVLVAPRQRAQDVKALVDELAARNRTEVTYGREVFRPWGSFDSLESRPGYQVKRLAVLPGAVLSLQLHHRRAEHWVVVSGVARITRDDEVFDLRRNEYAFIPVGARHRIENPGEQLLEIIEVQVGDYLGEDDIVRLEDRYGRQGRTD